MAGQRRMGRAEWGFLLALSAVWGGTFLLNRLGLDGLPPLTLVALRVGLAAPLLIAAVYIQGERLPRSAAAWASFAVMGAFNNVVPFLLLVWAQQSIASGLAAILNATTPFFTVIIAHGITTDERASAGKVLGVLLGLAGVALVIGPGALERLGRDVAAEGACLGAAVSYASIGLYGRRFRGLPPSVAAAGMVTSSALMLLPIALIHDRPWTLAPGAVALGAVGLQAVFGTAMAYWLYFRILATAGATHLMLVTLLMPPSALVLGWLILGERFPWTAFAGLAVIFMGLAAIDGRLARWVGHGRWSTSRPSERFTTD